MLEISFSESNGLQRVTTVEFKICQSRLWIINHWTPCAQWSRKISGKKIRGDSRNTARREYRNRPSCNWLYVMNRFPVYFNISAKGITNQWLYATYNFLFKYIFWASVISFQHLISATVIHLWFHNWIRSLLFHWICGRKNKSWCQ